MKNILFAFAFISLFSLVPQEKYKIIVENESTSNPFGVNNFYFTHHLFADAFFMTQLHKQLNYDEMHEILLAIQNGVTLEDKVTLMVPQEEGPDAKLVFMAKEHEKNGITFMMLTNFNKTSRKFEKFDGEESLVRWYFIQGDKLVYRKDLYSKSEERKRKKGDPQDLVDYYFFDNDVENDSKIKGLVDELLQSEDSKLSQLYGKLYLEELYLYNGEIDQAEKALEDLKVFFEKEAEIPRPYSLIVNMATTEFELMKRRNP